jgi:hypothetical protein
MPPITLSERTKINHQLKKLGFGGINDPNLFAQIATLYRTHESFRGLLMSTAPDQRRVAYAAIAPKLCFTAKPLDVYEREIHEKAEREQWDVIHKDNPHWPQPFKVGEVESDEYKLARLAEDAIAAEKHAKAKGVVELVCTHCTLSGCFPAASRKAGLKDAHDAGWRWAERNGVEKTYCPQHVPGRATMTLTCSNCGRQDRRRVWDQQDGYRTARLLGWDFNDEKCACPKCGAKPDLVQ